MSCPRPLDFRLNANNGLCTVGEADARAAVGAGEDACLSDEGAELCRRTAIGADGRGEAERSVEVGELRRRK